LSGIREKLPLSLGREAHALRARRVEQGQLVPALERGLDERAAEESGAAKDEEAQS